MTILLSLMAALLAQPPARAIPPGPRAGDVYEIRRVSEARWSEEGSGGSEGNSHDRDALVERVIMLRGDGVELEVDLPADATAEDRAAVWQFPARVLRLPNSQLRLLNAPELEVRLARWLERARWTREMCGRWIFTWNAFKIECDPQSALASLAAVDLTAVELRDGATWQDPLGLAPAVLRRDANGAFVADVEINPEVLQREQAESEAAIRDILGDSPEQRAYREAQRPRRITGTVRIRFEIQEAGRTLRRTRVITMQTERMGGSRENRTVTETVERRLVRPSA